MVHAPQAHVCTQPRVCHPWARVHAAPCVPSLGLCARSPVCAIPGLVCYPWARVHAAPCVPSLGSYVPSLGSCVPSLGSCAHSPVCVIPGLVCTQPRVYPPRAHVCHPWACVHTAPCVPSLSSCVHTALPFVPFLGSCAHSSNVCALVWLLLRSRVFQVPSDVWPAHLPPFHA